MRLVFEVEVELTFASGKFETKDTLSQEVLEAIEQADPGTVTGDNEGEYNVDAWDVRDITPAPTAKSKRHRKEQ